MPIVPSLPGALGSTVIAADETGGVLGSNCLAHTQGIHHDCIKGGADQGFQARASGSSGSCQPLLRVSSVCKVSNRFSFRTTIATPGMTE